MDIDQELSIYYEQLNKLLRILELKAPIIENYYLIYLLDLPPIYLKKRSNKETLRY